MKRVFQLLAAASLLLCMWAPVEHFLGQSSAEDYKNLFLAGTLGWFTFAAAAMLKGKR